VVCDRAATSHLSSRSRLLNSAANRSAPHLVAACCAYLSRAVSTSSSSDSSTGCVSAPIASELQSLVGASSCADPRSRKDASSSRVAVHTGETAILGEDVGGIGVHIGARPGEASGQEVLLTRTVRELAIGTDLVFRLPGSVGLKGIPGEWELFEASIA
jgi:class 3 adenylate cyclase